jgi:protein-disulfide isomerase
MRGGFVTAVALTALSAVVVVSPRARADEPMTKTQADTIIDELRQIRKLLERLPSAPSAGPALPAQPAPDQHVKIGVGTLPPLGRGDAPLTIVEFTDYQCSFCQRLHAGAFAEMKRNYVDTGKARFVSRDLPLAMHPNAMSAAHAARCAGEQDKFWEMRDALIVNANQLGPDRYNALADELKLDRPRFQKCLAEEKYKGEIAKDMADAEAAGVNGTPTFVIGRTVGKEVDGVRVVGAQPYATFDAKLKALLGGAQ